MEKDWHKIRTYNRAFEAELVKQMLGENGIPAVILNKQDSSYLFGRIELFVKENTVEVSERLISETSLETGDTNEN